MIELTDVNVFCDDTPKQAIFWATSTYIDGFTIEELDKDELAEKGISLGTADDKVTPIVTIYSEDYSNRNYTFYVTIRATTREDPSWFNTQILKVNYWPLPGPPPFDITTIYVSEDAPLFAKGASTSLGLEPSEDGVSQIFAPVTLSCRMKSWERELPPIEGEIDEEEIII